MHIETGDKLKSRVVAGGRSKKGIPVRLSDSVAGHGLGVPELLRNFRIAKGITQQTLADSSGVSRKHIAQIETEKANPTIGTLSELAYALELNPQDLVGSNGFPMGLGKKLVGPRYYLPVFQGVLVGDPLNASLRKQFYREVLPQHYRTDRYILRMMGDEMERVIHRNDLILVENGAKERNGKIVTCTLNGRFLIRRFEERTGLIILKAENLCYDVVVVTDEDQFVVHGVVLELISRKL